MARQVDFGDDVDMTLSSILDEVAEFVLGVEASVTDGIVYVAVMPEDRTITIRTYLSQLRVFLDFDAPALVFAEVEVELVHVVQGHHVEVNLHRIQVHEMAARVEVHAAIGEVGIVSYCSAR